MDTTYSVTRSNEGRLSGAGALLALAFAVFFALALRGAFKPFTSDEHWFVIAACDIAGSGSLPPEALIHPPLYSLINGFLLRVFGGPAALKIFGVLTGAASMALMWFLGRAAGAGRFRAALAAALLGLSPLFIQGSLLLDTDNTIVVFFLLLSLLAVFKERWLLLAVSVALLFWAKLTAALPLLAAVSGWGAWAACIGDRRGARVLLAIPAGALLFLATFYAYCQLTGLPFAKPFQYLYGAFFSKAVSGGGGSLRQAAQFALWAGPAFCLLWLATAVRAFRDRRADLDAMAALISVAAGAGYFFVGGTPFGFPKFQVPAFALGCWLVSAQGEEILSRPRAAFVLYILAGAVAVWAVGDPIYTLRFRIRELLAAGGSVGHDLYLLLAAQAALQPLLAVLFLIPLRREITAPGRRFAAALLLACLSGFAGMDALQVKSHNTIYTYGATGVREAAQAAAAAVRDGGKGTFPVEITAYLRLEGFNLSTVNNGLWSDIKAIKAAAADPEHRIFMFGTPFNTLAQLRVLNGPEATAAFAAGGWTRSSAGSYEIWSRPEVRK